MVRNAKAKVRRTAKNYGIDLSFELPPISEFKTREQFNEFKDDIRSFTNRANLNYQFQKNQFGVVASKKELLEIEQNTKRAQHVADKLREQAKEKPFISGGKKQGTVGQRMAQMGKPETAGISRPPDFDFDKIRSRAQLEKKMKNIEKRADEKFFDKRMEQLKDNFTKLIDETFNSDAEELIERLKKIPADDFYEMFLMFDEFDFDYIYVQDFEGRGAENDFIAKLSSYVDRYYDGQINLDMKGF